MYIYVFVKTVLEYLRLSQSLRNMHHEPYQRIDLQFYIEEEKKEETNKSAEIISTEEKKEEEKKEEAPVEEKPAEEAK